jgi:LEA14-like dessication related protein
MKKYVVPVTIVVVLSYLAYWLTKQFMLLKQTTVNISNYSISGILTRKAMLQMDVSVQNNSDLSFFIKKAEFDVLLNGQKIADAIVPVEKNLTARSTQTINVMVFFINGTISVKTGLVTINRMKTNTSVLLSQILKK